MSSSLVAAMVVSAGWYLVLVEVWPSDARPYIGGSQHDSIVELALGYNGLGRLTGDEPGGLGNMNFDVGWGRLFGHSMGTEIAWLLPAAVICLGAIVVLTRRAPRTDLTRAAALIWGGWLLVTAVVFSFMNGIVHPYYTVALAPAIAALHRHRRNTVVAEPILASVRDRAGRGRSSSPRSWRACCWPGPKDGCPGCRAAIAVGGLGAAVLLLVSGRLSATVARSCRRPGDRGVLGGTGGVFRRDGGHAASRRDTVRRARHALVRCRWAPAAC